MRKPLEPLLEVQQKELKKSDHESKRDETPLSEQKQMIKPVAPSRLEQQKVADSAASQKSAAVSKIDEVKSSQQK